MEQPRLRARTRLRRTTRRTSEPIDAEQPPAAPPPPSQPAPPSQPPGLTDDAAEDDEGSIGEGTAGNAPGSTHNAALSEIYAELADDQAPHRAHSAAAEVDGDAPPFEPFATPRMRPRVRVKRRKASPSHSPRIDDELDC